MPTGLRTVWIFALLSLLGSCDNVPEEPEEPADRGEPTNPPSLPPGRPPPGPPAKLVWGSGASGALLEDTVPLIAYCVDSTGAFLTEGQCPQIRWSSSNTNVLRIVSSGLALAADTGTSNLIAVAEGRPDLKMSLSLRVVPPWYGRLVWQNRYTGFMVRTLPGQEVTNPVELGISYPHDPDLTSDGRGLALVGHRPAPSKSAAVAPSLIPPPPPSPLLETIYMADLEGGGTHALLESLMVDQTAPHWLSLDTALAFLMRDSTGRFQVFTSQPEGGELRQLTRLTDSISYDFDLTPQGTLVVMMPSPQYTDLFELSMTGDTVRRLTNTPHYYERNVDVSPDGSMIAYQIGLTAWIMNRDGSNARLLAPTLFMSADWNGRPRKEHAASTYPSWTPDSKWVLFTWELVGDDVYGIRVDDSLIIRLTRGFGYNEQAVFR
jgi:hypothetical protein